MLTTLCTIIIEWLASSLLLTVEFVRYWKIHIPCIFSRNICYQILFLMHYHLFHNQVYIPQAFHAFIALKETWNSSQGLLMSHVYQSVVVSLLSDAAPEWLLPTSQLQIWCEAPGNVQMLAENYFSQLWIIKRMQELMAYLEILRLCYASEVSHMTMFEGQSDIESEADGWIGHQSIFWAFSV